MAFALIRMHLSYMYAARVRIVPEGPIHANSESAGILFFLFSLVFFSLHEQQLRRRDAASEGASWRGPQRGARVRVPWG